MAAKTVEPKVLTLEEQLEDGKLRQTRVTQMVERYHDMAIEQLREDLIQKARWLARDLTRLADGLEAGQPSFNSLGVVQGSGGEIDRMCGLLAAAEKNREQLKQELGWMTEAFDLQRDALERMLAKSQEEADEHEAELLRQQGA